LVDTHPVHLREVDHEGTVADGLAGDVVAAAFDGDEQAVLAGELHAMHDVGGVDAAGDERRAAVDHAVPDLAGVAVVAVAGGQQAAPQGLAQRRGRLRLHLGLRAVRCE
jgi:hypothetical protein